MTIFVTDPVPKELYKDISKQLMQYTNIHGEQVGFLTSSKEDEKIIKLDMMGGEFCGNASRSLGALLVYNNYPYIKQKENFYEVKLQCSGYDKVLNCEVNPTDALNIYYSKIDMPLPNNIKSEKLENYQIYKVEFSGIYHFVVNSNEIENEDEFFELIKNTMEENYSDYDAFGIMFYNFNKNYLKPLVYVKATDSLFWEESCASGTSAVVAALAYKKKEDVSINIRQPGGELEATANYSGEKINNITIKGTVEIVAEGIVNVNL
ncbi:diaminopimelate epimerase [Clostridium cochlearium]|jgi:diaminopimelate epimerase|uniref:diaminopimelate epimerase n=1 Tax=Clostridium cochlearium TaxID=1494 RepID=UPI00241EDCA5|nr:diaminopimelate epimerase [Clostridium cochlearium]